MTYTEFVCKPARVDAAASNLNGGSGGTPLMFLLVTVANGVQLQCGNWNGVVAGQFLTFDTTGTKRRCRIVSIDGVVGLHSQITVAVTDGGGPLPNSANYTVVVGGAWADLSAAAGLTTASVDAAGDPPRLNVLAQDGSGNPITYAVAVAVVNSGTAACPITIEGYKTTYGDLRGTMTAPLIQLNSGISTSALVQVNGSYVILRNLSVATTQAVDGIQMNGVNNCQVINCTVAAPNGNYGIHLNSGSYHIVDTCLLASNAIGVYAAGSSGAQIINCRFVPTASGSIGIRSFYSQTPTVVGCVFYNFTGDGIAWYGPYGLTILNCTFHAITGNAINTGYDGVMTDLTSLVVEGCIFAGITGKAIYSTASPTQVVPGRVAHNIAYNVNGVQTPGSFGAVCSSNVLDSSQDTVFANPFAAGETLAAAAKQHAVPLADGVTTSYGDFGAVQAQAAAGGLLVHGGMTGGMT